MPERLSAGAVNAILTPLHDRGVDCIVVGGAAAWAHGASLRPHDIDVVLRFDVPNAQNAAAALIELHGRYPDYSHYLDGDSLAQMPPARVDAAAVLGTGISMWETDHGGLDFLDSVSTRSGALYYEHLAERAETRNVAGVRIAVASIDDVIASKDHAGRPKDLPVLDELRRIAAHQRGSTAPPFRTSLDRPGITPPNLGRDHGPDR